MRTRHGAMILYGSIPADIAEATPGFTRGPKLAGFARLRR
jgi:hypothetical protein